MAITTQVSAECTWLCMFSSSDSTAATHRCRTGVMIFKSFISSTLTGKNGSLRLFQKARKPLEQHVNGSLKAANLIQRDQDSSGGRSSQFGKWMRPGQAKPSKLHQAQHYGPQHGITDFFTKSLATGSMCLSPSPQNWQVTHQLNNQNVH